MRGPTVIMLLAAGANASCDETMVLPVSAVPSDLPANFSAPATGTPWYDDSSTSDAAPAEHSALTGFTAFGLPTPIIRAVRDLGFQQPTSIQQEAIPALVAGRDVTGVAQTGTGKTAAFGLPLLASVDPSSARVQALVLVPTRELAIQVADAITSFAAHLPSVGVIAIYGGSSMPRQITALKRGAQIVVGTPGRVIDLIERRSLKLDAVTFAVLDEADEMLRMGFAEDVDRILTEVPSERQTALFSATMPKEIRKVAATHLRRPVDVSVAASATPVANIEQEYIVLPFRDKTTAVQRIIAVADADAAVVFVRTRSACDELGSALIAAGVKAAFISGDVSQNERERTIDRLRSGQVDVLVATDVAARGMDVERLGLVVNFDAPADPEAYIHRVGRTGRAGRSGRAVTFFTPKETSRLRYIEKTIGRKLTEITVPSAQEVLQQQASYALAAAAARLDAGRLSAYAKALEDAAADASVSTEMLAAALLATVVGDDGAAHVDPAPVRQRPERDDRFDHSRRERWGDRGQGGRNDRTEGRAGRGSSAGSRYETGRNDHPRHDSHSSPEAPNRADRRAGAYGAQDATRPAREKPRWDKAKKAQRTTAPSTWGDRDSRGSSWDRPSPTGRRQGTSGFGAQHRAPAGQHRRPNS